MLPKREASSTIENLQKNVMSKEWGMAEDELDNLNTLWEKNKVTIQIANADTSGNLVISKCIS